MKKNRKLAFVVCCLIVVSMAFTGTLFAAEQLTIKGKMEEGGTRMDGEDGKKYTINASNDMSSDISRLGGKLVEMTGVVRVSHGRNILTVLSYKVIN